MDGAFGCCWQCRCPALPFPSLLSPLWPTPSLQSHGSGLDHCFADNAATNTTQLTGVVEYCPSCMWWDPLFIMTLKADRSAVSQAETKDCCHMLLVCNILSNSTPDPEVNHGCALLPTFAHIYTHPHRFACTFTQTSPHRHNVHNTPCIQKEHRLYGIKEDRRNIRCTKLNMQT